MKLSVQLIWVKAIRKQWVPNRKECLEKLAYAMSFQAFVLVPESNILRFNQFNCIFS
jgi:hypothetical protein